MKLKNVVVGIRIQAKRDVTDYSGTYIPRGFEATVGRVQNSPVDSYPVRIDRADLEVGFAWVDPKDFRKVKEVVTEGTTNVEVCTVQNTEVGDLITSTVTNDGSHVASQPLEVGKQYKVVEIIPEGTSLSGFTVKIDVPCTKWSADSARGGYYGHVGEFTKPITPPATSEEPAEEVTEHTYKVGDKVLVGAEGAGYCYAYRALAGQVCTVTKVGHLDHKPACVEIVHPTICSEGWSTLPKYISPYVEQVHVGDWVVCSAPDGGSLLVGHAYQVVAVREGDSLLVANLLGENTAWATGYTTRRKFFNKVLREVQPDADTPT